MKNIKFLLEEDTKKRIENYKEDAKEAYNKILNTDENDMLGWLRLPKNIKKKEIEEIKKVAKEINKNADVLLVIGVGGSYLGAKAALDFLGGYYEKKKGLEVIFVGNNLSERYIYEVGEYIKNKDFYINVISKSGGTLEPAVAFRYFRDMADKKYKKKANKHIIATTDKNKGILKEIANKEKYRTFVVPDNIGGRYSVLTAVGLLPIAAKGYDIEKLLKGAKNAMKGLLTDSFENEVVQYASARNLYHNIDKKDIEVFATMKPCMISFSEWLKQLFGESECKSGKGIFPASMTYTTDLHSMGQLMQEGKRNIFETFVDSESEVKTKMITIINKKIDDDHLNYVKGRSVNELNNVAREATIKAHRKGGIPIIKIVFSTFNEETLGELFYFFELSCAISATILGVNPFNQPGVEEYKKNIKESLK